MANERDLLNRKLPVSLYYGVPILAMVAAGPLGFSRLAMGITWAVSLGVMGGACLWNAWRCGRVHCYVTGPFFFLVGIMALFHGLQWLDLGTDGWSWLGGVLLLGAIGLTVVPEKLWGRYRKD
jgi:hypothetical protein